MNVRHWGQQPYQAVWDAMKHFTAHRDPSTADELWLLEHEPVYTQGQAGKAEHIRMPSSIPLVQSDRGGQVTYHGPGQLIAYILMDLRRSSLTIGSLVRQLEQVIIQILGDFSVSAHTQSGAPGVYVDNKKIASIGLRVKQGCTYHGIAFNVAMDLQPFANINPCGNPQLLMTQLCDFVPEITVLDVMTRFEHYFLNAMTAFLHDRQETL